MEKKIIETVTFIIENIKPESDIPKEYQDEFNEWCKGLVFADTVNNGKGYEYFNTENGNLPKDIPVSFIKRTPRGSDKLLSKPTQPSAEVSEGDIFIYKSKIRKGKRKPSLTINKKYTIEGVQDSYSYPYPKVAIRDNDNVLQWHFFGKEFKRAWERHTPIEDKIIDAEKFLENELAWDKNKSTRIDIYALSVVLDKFAQSLRKLFPTK